MSNGVHLEFFQRLAEFHRRLSKHSVLEYSCCIPAIGAERALFFYGCTTGRYMKRARMSRMLCCQCNHLFPNEHIVACLCYIVNQDASQIYDVVPMFSMKIMYF